jgi:hypothetical protein
MSSFQNNAHARPLQRGKRTWVIAALSSPSSLQAIIAYPSGDGEVRGPSAEDGGQPRTRPVFFKVEAFDVSGNRFD